MLVVSAASFFPFAAPAAMASSGPVPPPAAAASSAPAPSSPSAPACWRLEALGTLYSWFILTATRTCWLGRNVGGAPLTASAVYMSYVRLRLRSSRSWMLPLAPAAPAVASVMAA